MIETFITLIAIAIFLTTLAYWQRSLIFLIFAFIFWLLAGAYYGINATTTLDQLVGASIALFAIVFVLGALIFSR